MRCAITLLIPNKRNESHDLAGTWGRKMTAVKNLLPALSYSRVEGNLERRGRNTDNIFSTRPSPSIYLAYLSDTAILMLPLYLFKKQLLNTYHILDIMLGTWM